MAWIGNFADDFRNVGKVQEEWVYSREFKDLPEVKMQQTIYVNIRKHRKTKKNILHAKNSKPILAESTNCPPNHAELLIKLLFPLKYQDDLLGMLNEKYNSIGQVHGKKKADAWFWWQASWAVITNVCSKIPLLKRTVK